MAILGLLLLFGACVGHTAVWAYSLNWLYGTFISRRLLMPLRYLHGVIVMTGWCYFVFGYGLDMARLWDLQPGWSWARVMAGYITFCWVLAFGVIPVIAIARRLTLPPAALRSNHTRVVDVARELGYKPAGRGKHRRLAHLPGNQLFQVEFSDRTLHLPQLPTEWEGLTILHLSDLHLSGTPDREFYEHVMEACAKWEPDLVAMTGDVVDSHQHHRWIVPILGRLRWKVAAFAILGNHDSWHDPSLVRRRLRRIGMRVPGNGWEQIEVRGRPMVVVGQESPWFQPGPDLRDCPEGVFRLCLSHTPDNMPWARQHRIDLMLAGHNHGGQIRFPLVGSVLVPSRFSRRYDCGTYHEESTVLHVSRGLGGQHPLRFNCRPEVTRLILTGANTGD